MGFLSFLLRPSEKKKQDQEWEQNGKNKDTYGKFLSFLGQTGNEIARTAINTVPAFKAMGDAQEQVRNTSAKVQQSEKVDQKTKDELRARTESMPDMTGGAKDLAVSFARGVPRAMSTLALGATDAFSTNPDKNIKEIDPSKFDNSVFGQTARALLGSEKIEGPTGEGAKLASSFGADEKTARTIGTYAGVPLAILSVDPRIGGGKAKAGEEVVSTLSKLSKAEDVTKFLSSAKGALGIADDAIKKVAPDLAKATNADDINRILKGAGATFGKTDEAAAGVKVYRGSKGNVVEETKDFGKTLDVAGDQKQLIEKLAASGNKDAQRVLDEANGFGGRIQYKNADEVIKKELGGQYDAIRYSNDQLPGKGVEYHNLTDNRFYSENPDVAKQYAMQSRKAKYATESQIGDEVIDTAKASEPTGPKNQAEYLVDTLKNLGVQTPDSVGTAISEVGTAKRSTPVTSFLEGMKSPGKVLTSHFGAKGGDVAYELQKSAHTVEQGQQVVAPIIENTTKLMKQVAKTDAGKKEVSRRIYSALEDRANADQYLKSDTEKQLFDQVAEFFDIFKEERASRGLAVVGENYGPRAQIMDALTAPDRMMQQVSQAFKRDTTSPFSKERTKEIAGEIDNTDIIGMMQRYANSQLKEFGYTPAMQKAQEALSEINPAYLTDKSYNKQGIDYLQRMFQDALSPQQTTKVERMANKALQTTYKNALSFNPRFIAQNFTQRWLSKAETSMDARSLARKMDGDTLTDLRSGLSSGDNPFFTELSGIEGSGVKLRAPGPLNVSNKVEIKNITTAYDRGASQAIVDSPAYKEALKSGMKPAEAARKALEDPTTKDLAQRAGNMLVNRTQFGANLMAKPEFFRSGGMLWGILPKSFVKQYGRFQAGIIENIGDFMSMKKAREYDILQRGNPAETQIVDYKRSAEALQGAVKDMTKAVKRGEIQGVELADIQLYKKQLDNAVKILDKEIKANSQIRGAKKVSQYAKMWAAATAIQFLFSGGGEGSLERSAKYASPVNVPSKDQNPLTVPAPSITKLFSDNQSARTRAALNFVPGVGLAVNRARDFNNLYKTLTGSE